MGVPFSFTHTCTLSIAGNEKERVGGGGAYLDCISVRLAMKQTHIFILTAAYDPNQVQSSRRAARRETNDVLALHYHGPKNCIEDKKPETI